MNILDSFNLRGKVAVLTGAAGLVGRQVACGLAQAGARTFITSRSVERLNPLATRLVADGSDVIPLALEQSDEDSIRQLLAQVVERAGRVDVLVNNAVEQPMKDWDSPAETFRRSMEVNATGMFMMMHAFGEQMARQGRGSMINVGSIKGMVGPDWTLYEGLDWGIAPDYFFHKGGLLQLSRFAAAKLGPYGVRVNTVSPGGFLNQQEAQFVERYNARTFLGRMANDTDLMGVVVFLASDASAYITGANIAVDGGYTAK